MAMAVTPRECSRIEVLFRYRRKCTPKVLTIACETRTAAYIPIVRAGVGT